MSITLALGKESMDADGKEASFLATSPVANLFQLTTGRTNELWNVEGLVALTLSLEPIPTLSDNHISGRHCPLIACTGSLAFRFSPCSQVLVDGGSPIVS